MITLITILGVSLLIILHELGHYLAARSFGMRVTSFSIGFGPALLSRRVGETIWKVSLVPLGGYVQIEGMGPEDNPAPAGHGFRDKPRWQRALVLAAGPAANWIVAALCLTVLAMSVGLHDNTQPSTELSQVEPGMAAAQAGIVAGDRIVTIDGVAIDDWAALVREVRKHPRQTIPIELDRNGQRLTVATTPQASSDGTYGVLGVQPSAPLVRYGLLGGAWAGVAATADLTATQARLLWGVVTGRQEGRLSGLPGIVRTLSAQARRSFAQFFETLATLSVVLCILNLVPIPSLDGARLAFLGVEAVRRRPLSETIEGWVHGVGLVLLLGLILFVSVRDLL